MTQAQRQAIEQLRTLTGRRHVHLTGRGAAGIFAVLRASGIQGKDILIPANTCYIVLWAVIASGNRPRLTDIDPLTGNVTPATLQIAYTSKTAAIIPCHMYGIPAPMAEICEWAKTHQLLVIEDAALAIGNHANDRLCGAWGDASILSFGLGKTVDVEVGGAVVTDDEILSERMERILQELPLWNTSLYRLTRDWNELYWALHRQEHSATSVHRWYADLFQQFHEITAYRVPPSYWDDLPSALSVLNVNLVHRRKIASIYRQNLANAPVRLRDVCAETALWKFPIFVGSDFRANVLETLWAQGHHEVTCWYPSLQTMSHAILPTLPQPSTPQADLWGVEAINLPLSQTILEADAIEITRSLINALR